MTHTIGHLHHRFRFYGTPDAALQSHLERLLVGDILDAYGEALDAVLRDDPTVYLMREVRLRVFASDVDHDVTLTRAWGQGMAKTVVQMFDDPDNVMQFEDQAAFAASFIEDWLHGRAWMQWYYGAFAHVRNLPPDDALCQVLLENRLHLPAILARLCRQDDTLLMLFRQLSEQSLRLIWQDGLRDSAASEVGIALPLVMNLIQWANRLNLWLGAPPSPDRLTEAFFRARRLVLDWRDTASLTAGFAELVWFCVEQGWLRVEPGAAQLQTAIESLDWLDRALLRRLLASAASSAQPVSLAALPRHRALLHDLGTALSRLHLSPGEPDSVANALRWYAVLMDVAPQWAGDPFALDLIQAFLGLWAGLFLSADPRQTLDLLHCGALDEALHGLPESAGAQLRWLAALGQDGFTVVEALLAQSAAGDRAGLETRCAGLFLLLRPILDSRLLALTGDTSVQNVLLAALAWHWAEKDGDMLADPGLLLFAGLPEAATLSTLQERWHEVSPLAFQTALMRVLAGLRLIHGEQMTLHRIRLFDGQIALIAEADSSGVWVFGQIGAANLPPDWLTAWEDVTGIQPTVVEAADSTGLVAALDTLGVEFDLTISLAAAALLRLWARWLGSFAASSIPYLLQQFVRRAGTIDADDAEIRVRLESRPLDIVLGSAGYLADLEKVGWLGSRRVRFEI